MALYNTLLHEKWIKTSRHQSRTNIRTANSSSILLLTFDRLVCVAASGFIQCGKEFLLTLLWNIIQLL